MPSPRLLLLVVVVVVVVVAAPPPVPRTLPGPPPVVVLDVKDKDRAGGMPLNAEAAIAAVDVMMVEHNDNELAAMSVVPFHE